MPELRKYVSVPVNGRAVQMLMEDAEELYAALRKLFDKTWSSNEENSKGVTQCDD
jgi:hypothetical protein